MRNIKRAAFSCQHRFRKQQKPTSAATESTKILRFQMAGGADGESSQDYLDATLPRFGPICGEDSGAMQEIKDLALKRILKDDKRDDYFSSIANILMEIIGIYNLQGQKPGYEFQENIVKDGCFFLLVALHILGGGVHLGFPYDHPYFGKDRDLEIWIPSLFFVGNQIPYIVVRALMKQNFFQEVIKRGRWGRPTQDPLKLVLYRTVVEPELSRPAQLMLPPTPSHIVQALHSLLLGPGNYDPDYSEMKEFPDLEAGGDSTMSFPSAGELLKSGIWLRKTNKGITNILFRNFVIRACLYVPPLMIDKNTVHMLKCVARYEQLLNESDREVTAYFRLMRDLAPTYKDFKILERNGIIEVKGRDFKYGKVLETLKELVDSQRCNFTLSFRDIRSKIKDYEKPPWKFISFVLGLLTVANTVIAILSYVKPIKTS